MLLIYFVLSIIYIFLPCCTDKALKSAILFKSDKDEIFFFILQTDEEINRITTPLQGNYHLLVLFLFIFLTKQKVTITCESWKVCDFVSLDVYQKN